MFKASEEIDAIIGRKLKDKRKALKMSQTTLAEKLQVSFQQVQKYESGKNQISSSRLFHLSKILGCQPSYFLEDRSLDSAVKDEPIKANLADYNKSAYTLRDNLKSSIDQLNREQMELVLQLIQQITKK